MTENTRNQHKNTMKDRPLGQTSIDQRFGGQGDLDCFICGVEPSKHDDKKCQEEYEG